MSEYDRHTEREGMSFISELMKNNPWVKALINNVRLALGNGIELKNGAKTILMVRVYQPREREVLICDPFIIDPDKELILHVCSNGVEINTHSLLSEIPKTTKGITIITMNELTVPPGVDVE